MNCDEIVVFSLTSSIELTNEICDYLKIKPSKTIVSHFADGEILVELQNLVRGRKVYIIQSTCSPVTERLMEVLVCIDACKRSSAGEINLVIPYFGYARQDRKARPRQPITAKLVADLLEVAGANRIVTIDLHASQIQGFFRIPIDDLTAIPAIGKYFNEKGISGDNVVVVSPDHGGTVRARNLASKLDAPIAIIDKICIIVDDIVDTAGSLVAGANILKAHGAKEVYAGITHGVFSKDAITTIENSLIKELVITNSIPLSEEQKKQTTKITQISIAYMLAKTIEAIQYNKSVSEVYDMFEINKEPFK